MSDKIQLKSLLQLTQYSQFKAFLKDYHKVVNEEFGQYLSVNKALICVEKLFPRFANKHEMISSMKNSEDKKELFTVKKEVMTLIRLDKNSGFITEEYSSCYSNEEDLLSEIKRELRACQLEFSPKKVDLLERFNSYFNEDQLSNFKSSYDIIDAVIASDIEADDLINDIAALSNDRVEFSISTQEINFTITPEDIKNSIATFI
jgi:hypothetical protein